LVRVDLTGLQGGTPDQRPQAKHSLTQPEDAGAATADCWQRLDLPILGVALTR